MPPLQPSRRTLTSGASSFGAERRGDGQLDVEADSLAMAEGKADAYAAYHDLTHFRVLNIAPLAAHQYRQA
ncbi:hypothetical protein [Cupriavidus sp. TMH.W2]|uniref:hypothetical protein n=1 Tax=Cupriavidus sp. TMH.W2 TaxID=3434465 RepID=UPI003D772869